MAPLPKRRWSTHRQGKKRANLAIKLPALVTCPNCGTFTLPHRACAECGHYKGKRVIRKNENAQGSKAPKKKKGN